MRKLNLSVTHGLSFILLSIIIVAGCASSSNYNPQQAASDAAIYGFPSIVMDFTRKVMTNTPNVTQKSAPINQFCPTRELVDYRFVNIVRPNNDTLYDTAWIDTAKEPWIISVPDTGGRYYLLEMVNYWTDVFASPGSRTTGTGPGNFAITGPGWTGSLPAGVTELKCATRYVWILGRVLCNGPADYQNVWDIQDKITLTPLSAWGGPYVPPSNVPIDPTVNMNTPPLEQTMQMDAVSFFERLCQIMIDDPPYLRDAPVMEEFARIGIAPGADFRSYYSKLDSATQVAILNGYNLAMARIPTLNPGTMVNGWSIWYGAGDFGANYEIRAATAYFGVGANLNADAIYPTSDVMLNQQKYSSDNKYVMHFSADQIPPVNAFWSLTMYNDQQLLAQNPINRYKLGTLSVPPLVLNADGSIDLYIQRDSPGAGKENNWLPTPASGGFSLTMRLYWPKQPVLDKTWVPPPIQLAQ